MPLEYRVKAAYLFNFAKFVDWPAATDAGRSRSASPDAMSSATCSSDTVRGETINGRPLTVRVILEPEPGCHIIFVPRGATAPPTCAPARRSPS